MTLLSGIRYLQTQSNIKLMATSRLIHKIKQSFSNNIRQEIRASNDDVEQYLKGQMPQLLSYALEDLSLTQLIIESITQAVNGM